jgi:hypothetical protein
LEEEVDKLQKIEEEVARERDHFKEKCRQMEEEVASSQSKISHLQSDVGEAQREAKMNLRIKDELLKKNLSLGEELSKYKKAEAQKAKRSVSTGTYPTGKILREASTTMNSSMEGLNVTLEKITRKEDQTDKDNIKEQSENVEKPENEKRNGQSNIVLQKDSRSNLETKKTDTLPSTGKLGRREQKREQKPEKNVPLVPDLEKLAKRVKALESLPFRVKKLEAKVFAPDPEEGNTAVLVCELPPFNFKDPEVKFGASYACTGFVSGNDCNLLDKIRGAKEVKVQPGDILRKEGCTVQVGDATIKEGRNRSAVQVLWTPRSAEDVFPALSLELEIASLRPKGETRRGNPVEIGTYFYEEWKEVSQ